ncbi:MAG: FtsH protease activity modulator HflK [Caulobacteraceae bacterium]
MPWNDNANPGPWGSPPGGNDDRPEAAPRQEPRRRLPPPPSGPDLRKYVRRLRVEWNRLMRGRRGDRIKRSAMAGGVGVVLAAWAVSGVYFVQPYQQAIVTRFGAYERTESPGLRYHLPVPIERVQVLGVTNEQNTVIGGSPGAEATGESLMPTGDGNIVDVSFAVEWHVSDPAAYLFQARDPAEAVKAVAESAMREAVGRDDLTSIQTNGRAAAQSATLALTQRVLDRYHAGVTVDAVRIQNVNPPPDVLQAYQDVARAGQDAQLAISGAKTYSDKTVSDADGAAAKITQAAEAHREQVVGEAKGEASRFSQVDAQYRRAPEIMRQRMYLQTMQDVLAKAHVVVIGAKRSTAPIVLPPPAAAPGSQPTQQPPQVQAPQTPQDQSQGPSL